MSDGAEHDASAGREELDALIDGYVDGTLSADQRRGFEARLRTDPEAARVLELQRRIDGTIRRLYEPPAMPAFATEAQSPVVGVIRPAANASGRRRLSSRPLAMAAALALAAIGGYWAMVGSPMGGSQSTQAMATPQAVYQRVVAGGFKPEWVCEDAKQFADYTRDRFGAAWSVEPVEGLTLVGWRYSHDLLGPDASLLLVEQGGEKIVVVADAEANDRRLREGGGLHVFRRAVGGVVLYEISPLEEPVVVGRIEIEK